MITIGKTIAAACMVLIGYTSVEAVTFVETL